MTFTYLPNKDIFDSQAQVLVNPVNCMGTMGKGLALEFKQRYPDMHPIYREWCDAGEIWTGHPKLWKFSPTRWILCFPTKQDWRNNAHLRWISEGLLYVAANYRRAGIESIAFPMLGTGLGGLSWPAVNVEMRSYLNQLDIPVEIYGPNTLPAFAERR